MLQDAAGQLRRSPYQFSGIGGSSPQLFLALGYAVLDGPTLPIIAEGEEEPNDTYLEQLMAGAKAAVEASHPGLSTGLKARSQPAFSTETSFATCFMQPSLHLSKD